MANSRSARKRIRSSERKRIRNRDARSAVRTRVAKVRRSLVSGQTADVEEELRAAVQSLDKAAEKGILHRNNAARRKSRIMTMAARLAGMGGSEAEKAATRSVAAGGSKGTSGKPGSATARSRARAATAPEAGEKAATSTATRAATAPTGRAAAKPGTAKAPTTKPAPATPGTAEAPKGRRSSRSSS